MTLGRRIRRSGEPKTVLYLVPAPRISLDPNAATSGPARHILGMSHAMIRRGMQVDIWLASDRWYCRGAASVSEQNIRGSAPKLFLQDVLRGVLGLFNVLCVLFRPAPDLVYERLASMQCMGWVLKLKGSVWVVESNGLFYREASVERNSLFLVSTARFLERLCYRWADCVVTVSDELKAEVVADAGVHPQRVVVVRNAVDPTLFVGPSRETDPSTKRVGFVGTLVEWQGVDRLVEALSHARLVDLELHIVGDGPAWEALRQLSRERGVTAVFHGRVPADQIPDLMRSFSVAFCGHQMKVGTNYHSPLKLYEYAACGVPVVSTFSEDAVLLSERFPVAVLQEGWTSTDLAERLAAAVALPRPRPLVVTYDDRLASLIPQVSR